MVRWLLLLLLAGCVDPGLGNGTQDPTSTGTSTHSVTQTSGTGTQAPGPGCSFGDEGYPGACQECPWIDGCGVPPAHESPIVLFFAHPGAGPASQRAVTQSVQATTVEVHGRNDGDSAWVYRTYYQACSTTYTTDEGRKFLIPEGTHCDIANSDTIAPGETVKLFEWGLDECTKDNWGCAESRVLDPTTVHLRSRFCADRGDGSCGEERTTAAAQLEILAAP